MAPIWDLWPLPASLAAIALGMWYRRITAPVQPDKLVVDLNTVKAGGVIDLPPGARINQVEFTNPLDEQDYVLKKYVFASSAAEAIALDATTPVAEVFIADEKVQFQGRTEAVGFQSVRPEEE